MKLLKLVSSVYDRKDGFYPIYAKSMADARAARQCLVDNGLKKPAINIIEVEFAAGKPGLVEFLNNEAKT